jgi:hypothetical protein
MLTSSSGVKAAGEGGAVARRAAMSRDVANLEAEGAQVTDTERGDGR